MLEFLGQLHDWWDVGVVAALTALAGTTLYYRRRFVIAAEELSRSRILFENLSEGVYRALPDGRHIRANAAMARLQGYETTRELLLATSMPSAECYVDPNRGKAFHALLKRDGRVTDFVSEAYRHATGERIWISETARMLHDPSSGRPICYEGTVRDVTETMKRLQLEKLFSKLTSQLPGGLFQFLRRDDGSFDVAYISSGFSRMTGLSHDRGNPTPAAFFKLILDKDRARFMESFHRARKGERQWDHEFRICCDDSVKWLRVSAMPESVEDGVLWHGYINDISLRKAQESEISRLAYRDPLTELRNRRALMFDARKAMIACRRQPGHGALIFVDLDNFKDLNDRHGHEAGDRYLKQVARRLTDMVGDTGIVSRIGGDEFVVLLPHLAVSQAEAGALAHAHAQGIAHAMTEVFKVGHTIHPTSASVGLVVFDGGEPSIDVLLRQADAAMYSVKAAGGNGFAAQDELTLKTLSARLRDESGEPTSEAFLKRA